MVDYGLRGKVALVTGGSQGLGKSVAQVLAREGVNIAICARGKEALDATAAELGALGVQTLAVQADMTVPEDIEGLAAVVGQRYGRIDILVNNATSFPVFPSSEIPVDEAWVYHINVKVLGYVRMSRAVLPYMRPQHWGRIINIGGIAARLNLAAPNTAGVTNAAVANFTASLSNLVAKEGITVNCIHPGAMRTQRHDMNLQTAMDEFGITREEAERRTVARIPIGRMLEPEELGQTIAYLCSDYAGAITGQTLAIDGGGTGVPVY